MKRFNAWMANSKCEPIEGTGRILLGVSKRAVLQHIADENNVKHQRSSMVVKLSDGNFWCVSQI